MPGRFIQAMRQAKTVNPVFVLDEIDKLSTHEMHGDPAGALLEALDPEQNNAFEDHYLAMPYDLSQVIFICTANDISRIPPVLRDRLEIIEISGYTLEEKRVIARNYLVPRGLRDHGLESLDLDLSDETLARLAGEYTRESGVRDLHRRIEALLRDAAMKIAEGGTPPKSIDASYLEDVLGPPKYHPELIHRENPVGTVTGLGWTPTGGRLLFVEAAVTAGAGSHSPHGETRHRHARVGTDRAQRDPQHGHAVQHRRQLSQRS